MSDTPHIADTRDNVPPPPSIKLAQQAAQTTQGAQPASDSTAFRSQLEYLENPNVASHGMQQPLDLRSARNALTPTMYPPVGAQEHATLPQQAAMYLPVVDRMQQPNHSSGQSHQSPQMSQQNYTLPQHPQDQMRVRYFTPQIQTRGQYSLPRLYGMGYSPNSLRGPDPRFVQTGVPAAMQGQFPPYAQRGPEPVPVPSYPRGPPRKPKQSGYALWVGNLPPVATVGGLKDHFARDAREDIESLLLISKSNCAFVNYRSEAACAAAMTRFHDSRFLGVRLVCRLRRSSAASSGSLPAVGSDDSPRQASSSSSRVGTDGSLPATDQEPIIVHGSGTRTNSLPLEDAVGPIVVSGAHKPSLKQRSAAAAGNEPTTKRAGARFFIMKSLTAQDLESSVTNGIWATQNHNESTLNQAFQDADDVYLIFSANKSGEYFGYARMSSSIAGQPVNLNGRAEASSSSHAIAPFAVSTPATAIAPKGHIIDDSGRGTIFWEAELSDDEEAESREQKKTEGRDESTPGSNWGRQFSIEWISTERLPFYRTRWLRNPWNSNREVKIARDGTELEPSVGGRLIQMFHRPSLGYGTSMGW